MHKKQFNHYESNEGLWYVEELSEWHTTKGYESCIIQSYKSCNSLRAFKRSLKKIAKKQPELIGQEFRLVSNWYEISKRGNKKSLSIIMKVKGIKNGNKRKNKR